MADNQFLLFTIVGLGIFLIGLSKGGLGGMLGAFITPLVALVMPLDQAIGLLLPILMLGDVFAIATHWRRWEVRLILYLIPGAIVGVTIATYFITNVPVPLLRRVLGVIVLIFILYRLFEGRIHRWLQFKTRNWHGLVTGSLSGFSSTLMHAGGPPITIYLLMQNLAPTTFVATTALFFAVLNWIKVPYYYYASLFDFDTQLRFLILVPLVPIGVWIGRRAAEIVDRVIFERVILVLLTASAMMLLLR